MSAVTTSIAGMSIATVVAQPSVRNCRTTIATNAARVRPLNTTVAADLVSSLLTTPTTNVASRQPRNSPKYAQLPPSARSKPTVTSPMTASPVRTVNPLGTAPPVVETARW